MLIERVDTNVETALPRILKEYDVGKRILILHGPGDTRSIGQRTYKILRQDPYFDVKGPYVVSEPSLDVVNEIIRNNVDETHKPSIDFVIANGGGKVIDTAKVVCNKLDIEWGSYPTSTGHDGIASGHAVPKELGKYPPHSVLASRPLFVIIDIPTVSKAPLRVNRSGYGDIYAKYTALLDWLLADVLKREGESPYKSKIANLQLNNVKRIDEDVQFIKETRKPFNFKNPLYTPSIRNLLEAEIISGDCMSEARSSRPASGGEHKAAHNLEQSEPEKGLHGEYSAIETLIEWWGWEKYGEHISEVLNRDLYIQKLYGKGWRDVKFNIHDVLGLPTPQQLGLNDSKVKKSVIDANRINPVRYTFYNFLEEYLDVSLKHFAEEALSEIYEAGL